MGGYLKFSLYIYPTPSMLELLTISVFRVFLPPTPDEDDAANPLLLLPDPSPHTLLLFSFSFALLLLLLLRRSRPKTLRLRATAPPIPPDLLFAPRSRVPPPPIAAAAAAAAAEASPLAVRRLARPWRSPRRRWRSERGRRGRSLSPGLPPPPRLWKQGFKEEAEWKHSNRNHFFSPQARDPMSKVKSLSHGFLRRFHSPTIFLKVVCDGDLLLPINVGEFAVKKLINDPVDDDSKECPDEFQFIKNVMGTYGYEVRMVCITERVMNTYYSRIFMGQLAGGRNISIDARPSDAINVAKNFQAPIYVNKEIVRRDAIEIIRGRWRGDNAKTIYDVSLDSAVEGPDLLAEELDLVRKMNTAIIQERYGEAAIWRDKLNKLRTPRNEP
ncbi:uncharacterized protein LOC109727559 isoform X2 [Ananas comosus]|uniref:Uncharacterized protein LOC109727559 isoform X2 n=1 Tax=Ananas comosus TaxID=4615 RepID=A0A6P5HB89_ANACO|nr:uncharacterized protein LOC109727559 isoform X2 [Ananas comosus]